MRDQKGFDEWAGQYDGFVASSERDNTYPFAGYSEVQNRIYRKICRYPEHSRVLDIGFGTAVLTSKLYQHGYQITGIDFSEKMAETAKKKMPEATLFVHDFSRGLPQEIGDREFDCILSTYALHHLNDSQKEVFITELLRILAPDGALYIGDVAFTDHSAMERCRRLFSDRWDAEEFYFTADTLRVPPGASVTFEPVSVCAGIFEIQKNRSAVQ